MENNKQLQIGAAAGILALSAYFIRNMAKGGCPLGFGQEININAKPKRGYDNVVIGDVGGTNVRL